MKRAIVAVWGVTGVLAILILAMYRLTVRSLDVLAYPMEWYHWIALTLSVVLMAYMEGYRGFQLAFSPRVAARTRYLMREGDLLSSLLAPLFLMSFFRAPLRRKISSYGLTFGVLTLVLLVRLLPPPWRAIVDAGVVVGLSWGVVSLAVCLIRALTSEEFEYSAEVC